ncbi:MAG: hypothetical protein JST82_07475 [Bacteroidetes bacterium]|nr:hypothetical protein [Bacteroidota bacterium]
MVNKENYEEYMLLYADGELSEAETKALLAFVDEHPELKSELEAYNATRLVPDTTMVYEHKEQLMKSSGGGRTIALGNWWMYAAAACVLLFAVMIFRNNDTNTIDSTSVAINEQPKTTPVLDTPKEDIHSNPVNSVSHENAIANKEKLSPKKQILNPQPQITNHQREISKEEIQVAKKEEPKIIKQPETQTQPDIQPQEEKPVIVKTETQPVVEEQKISPAAHGIEEVKLASVKENKGILSKLAIKEKTEGFTALADVVNDKIEKIKEVKNNLKDTDVKFRIGNKEILLVRL